MTEWFAGTQGIGAFLVLLALNLACMTIVVGGVYARAYGHRDYVFTYFLLNVVVFCLGFLMSAVRIELGLGLGLFAVFGILRYRTEAIGVRDLSYLLVAIGIGLINGLANGGISFAALLVVNAVVAAMVGALEVLPVSRRENSRMVLYDRLDMLAPERAAELLEDLRRRTHLPVERYEIGNVDLLRDSIEICVFYSRSGPRPARLPANYR